MRRVFAVVVCACVVALSGCGTLGTTGSEQASVKAASVAAQWEYFPDWKTLGLKLVGTPPRDVSGPVEVGVTTDKDVSLVGYLTDLSTGKELPQGSYPVHDGATWRLAAEFPKAGQYSFTLFGKLKSTAGDTYAALARASFVVTGDPASNWAVFPGFTAHGLSVVTVPPLAVNDEAQIALSTGEDLEFGWIFYDKTNDSYPSGQVRAQVTGSRVSFTVSFPETADYSLQLECRPSGADDNAWESIAMARFKATVSAANIKVPDNWNVTPGLFKRLGVAVVSAPPRAVTDQADIVLSSKVKMSLGYNLTNHTTGKDTQVMKDVVEIDQQDLEQHITLFFPDPGEYELWLWAKAEGDKDDAVLARVSFTATPSPAPKVPDNWEVAPRFKTYGLSVLSSSPRETGEELSVVIGVPEGWDGYASLRNKEGTSSVGAMASDIVGKEQRISAVFPRSGEYILSISGKLGTEKYSRTLATATFVVKVDESLSPYRLWRVSGSWPRVPVSKVQLVQEPWEPFVDYPSFDEYRTGVLTDALTVAAAQGNVSFAKGTTLTFGHDYGSEFAVDALSGNLAKDVTIKANGTTLLFSAGSPFVVAEKQAVGQLIRDTKIVLEGNTLLAPKGSRISYWESGISEIVPAGKPTLTVGAKVYEVNGGVQLDAGAKEGSPLTVKIKTARDYTLKIGTNNSFILPAGSLLSFTKQAVTDVVFAKDAKVTLAGAADTVTAGQGIRFDDKGVATKYTAEE